MAVFAPIPSACDNTATSVKLGLLSNRRRPNRRSCQNVSMLSSHRTDERSTWRTKTPSAKTRETHIRLSSKPPSLRSTRRSASASPNPITPSDANINMLAV